MTITLTISQVWVLWQEKYWFLKLWSHFVFEDMLFYFTGIIHSVLILVLMQSNRYTSYSQNCPSKQQKMFSNIILMSFLKCLHSYTNGVLTCSLTGSGILIPPWWKCSQTQSHVIGVIEWRSMLSSTVQRVTSLVWFRSHNYNNKRKEYLHTASYYNVKLLEVVSVEMVIYCHINTLAHTVDLLKINANTMSL